MPSRVPLLPLLFVLLAASTGALLRSARASRPSSVDAVLDAPSVPVSVLKILALGFRSVAADSQYLEAIQVYGDRGFTFGTIEKKIRRSKAVYRLLDYTTDFDPQFNYAYIFGANAIPVATTDDVPLNLDETVALLRKGTAEAGTNCSQTLPAEQQINCDWRIPFHLSYLLSEYKGELAEAAKAMLEASRRPKRPDYLPLLATRLAAAGGSPAMALDLCKAMYLNADTAEKKQEYLERCRLLQMEIDLRHIDDATTKFISLKGRLPRGLDELVAAGLLRAVPPEPHGDAYSFDAKGNAVAPGHPRLKLSDMVQREIAQNAERLRLLSASSKETRQ
jgi:hypothetical protein